MTTELFGGVTFYKMHGLGNDFIVFDVRNNGFAPDTASLQAIGDRRTGIGCDQFALIQPAKDKNTDAFMALYNNDGSVIEACGNATRCVARLLMEMNGTSAVKIRTVADVLEAGRAENGDISVNMKKPRLNWKEIGLARKVDTLNLPAPNAIITDCAAVSMGNPHLVCFVKDANTLDPCAFGPELETWEMYPAKTNVEFVTVVDRSTLRMRVWERGAGLTRACGTGACASAVAAMKRGLCERSVQVVLDGGSLQISWPGDSADLIMTGPATLVAKGTLAAEFVS